MEPYWNQVRIQQVVGRGVRRNSHIALPESDRNVEVFRYFSTIPRKNINFSKEKKVSNKKKKVGTFQPKSIFKM